MEFFESCQGVQELWNTSSPTLSICFRQTALVWSPCAVPWLFLPLEVYTLRKSRAFNIPWSSLSIIKLIFSTILTVLSLTRFVLVIREKVDGSEIPFYDILSPGLLASTFLLTIAIICLERKHGIRTSGILFFFWLLLFLCDSVNLRSVLNNFHDSKVASEDVVGVTLFFARYPLVIGQFVLVLFNDKRPTYCRLDESAPNACGVVNAPFVSKLFFIWLDRLTWRGYRTDLKADDVDASPPEISCANCVPPFLQSWEEQLRRKKRATFQSAIFSVYWPSFLKVWVLKLFGELVGYLVPATIGWYLQFISDDEHLWHGYVLVTALFVFALGESLAVWHATNYSTFIGFGTRVACTSMVFRKCLTLSNDARQEQVVGKIVNHVAVDVSKVYEFLQELSYGMTMVFSMTFGLFLIYNLLGLSAFAGLATILVLFCLNAALGMYLKRLEAKILTLKDQRIKLLNEAIAGIKVLKMFAWEPPFMDRISMVRTQEIDVIRLRLIMESVLVIIWLCAPIIVTITCLTTFVLANPNNILNPAKIFVTISIVNLLKQPMMHLSTLAMRFVQAYVSVKRLNEFMASENLNEESVQHDFTVEPFLLMDNCSMAWNTSEELVLRSINLRLDVGSLVAVVGPVGCGKSSLISAILGEMRMVQGRINTKGSTAYVPQQAWIQNATLQSNVLFGRACRPDVYQRILDACSLTHDLTTLPAGDQTEIGEKGVNLSGGQKQRVSLARAVYQDSDVYLLDDPLSAVDSHVGAHIFDNVIGPRGLLKGKSRILVTHSVTHLRHMDLIVFMDEGCIQEMGTYDQLMARRGTSATFLTTYGNTTTTTQTSGAEAVSDKFTESSETEPGRPISPVMTSDGALISDEHMEMGRVNKSVYVTYLRYLGFATVAVYLSFLIMGMTCYGYSQVWLSQWSMDTEAQAKDLEHRNTRLGIYLGLSLVFGLLVLFGLLTMVTGAVRASMAFHSRMLLSVLRSPAAFFDTTPSGRIVNRFAKDVEVVDTELIISFEDLITCMLEISTALVVICISLPVFLPVIAVVSVLYLLMQKVFVRTTDQLRRLESVTRSPVYSLLSEMLSGATVVRCFGRQTDFVAKFEETLDQNIKHAFYNRTMFRSMGLKLDFLGNVVICIIAIICIWKRDYMSAGTIALVVTYANVINFNLAWLVYCAGLVETNIVSVERLHEYIMLPSEAPWESSESDRPDELWPSKGRVEFRSFATRYREELPTCLRGISLDISDREKVGIVGRTGAGKTSVTLALLRIIEATEGAIIIDGVDISTIGLHDLRSRLTIIPQDPVLFIGTLRMNMDPFDRHSDSDLWKALELSHLKNFVSALPQGLMHEISEGGDNLSVGQRQLICLARALLRKSRILILDEATAAVDLETDDLIQATIRTEFSDCTVITIAHRLNTVLDNNRLVIMDGGTVKESGTPAALLGDKNSVFYGMARHSGVNRRRN